MAPDGILLKAFVEKGNLRPVRIYESMGISKQAFYKLFQTDEFEENTINKLEKALGKKWSEIRQMNVDVNVKRETKGQHITSIDNESRRTLERTLENLSEDKIRSTAIIERLVTMLEKQFSSVATARSQEECVCYRPYLTIPIMANHTSAIWVTWNWCTKNYFYILTNNFCRHNTSFIKYTKAPHKNAGRTKTRYCYLSISENPPFSLCLNNNLHIHFSMMRAIDSPCPRCVSPSHTVEISCSVLYKW
jgi:hypothetical protein